MIFYERYVKNEYGYIACSRFFQARDFMKKHKWKIIEKSIRWTIFLRFMIWKIFKLILSLY